MLVILIGCQTSCQTSCYAATVCLEDVNNGRTKTKKDASFAPEKFHLVSRKNTINVITTIVNMEGVVNEIWKGNYYFLEYN